MMKRQALTKHCRFYLYGLFFCAMGLLALTHALIQTELGAHVVVRALVLASKNTLTIDEVSGTLYDGLQLRHLEFENPDVHITIESATINWQLNVLLNRLLRFHTLYLNDVHVHRLNTSDSNVNAFSFFPFSIQMDDFQLKNLTITEDQKTIPIDAIYGAGSLSSDTLQFDDLRVFALDGALHTAGVLHFPRMLNTDLNADWNFMLHDKRIEGAGEIHIPGDAKAPIQVHIASRHDAENKISYRLEGAGTVEEHDVTLMVRHEDSTLKMHALGEVRDHTWFLKFNDLNAAGFSHQVVLRNHPVLQMTPQHIVIKSLCGTLDQLDFCGDGSIIDVMKTQQLAIKAQFKSPSLDTIQPFFELEGLKGAVQGEFQIQGTLEQPLTQLTLDVSKGSYLVPGLNVLIRDVAGRFVFDPKFDFTITAEGRVQEKPVSLEGHGNLFDSSSNVVLHIRGENLRLSDTSEVLLYASPNLTLEINEQQLTILGDVDVVQARIHLKEKGRALTPSSDARVVDTTKSDEPPFIIRTDLQIHLGNDVTFNGYNFKTKAKGNLQIHGVDDDLRAVGEIVLFDGKYEAYKRILNLKDGRLKYYHSPVFNPNLMIRAERTVPIPLSETRFENVEQMTIGVQVSGTVQSPSLHLYSIPAMSESEILAYMVLGRSSDLASAAEAAVLLEAAQETAAFLGLGEADVSNQIKEKFGFDEFSIESEKGEIQRENIPNVSVNMGKKLSERLYLQYSYSIADALNTVKLKYQLGRRWGVVGSTNARGSGGDVTYRVEKN